MESGEIHSDQITASSQYSTNWSAERSRLHYPENGWTPGEDSYREWIQVCGFYLAHQGRKFGLSTKVVEKNVPSWVPSNQKDKGTPNVVTLQNSQDQRKAQVISLKTHLASQILAYDSTESEHRCLTWVTTQRYEFFFPTATHFLLMCFLLQRIFISLMKYLNCTCRCAWSHCLIRCFVCLFAQGRRREERGWGLLSHAGVHVACAQKVV